MTGYNLIFSAKSKVIPLLLATFIGCTSSVQLVDTEVPIPAVRIDTVRVVETERVFVESPCDTGAILDALCQGSVSGTTDGVEWKVQYDKVARENHVLGVLTRRLADSVRVLVNKPATVIQLPKEIKEQIAQLEANQERHTWRDWLSAGAVGAGALLILATVVFVGLSIKRLLPPLKF